LKQLAAMSNSKGLPEQEKVKAFLALDCWQVNREFSSELLRAFSCMLSGKGLPKEDDVKAFLAQDCWQLGRKFSLKLLRTGSQQS
jgi:hypothetical protein